jgi:hypothetical protein
MPTKSYTLIPYHLRDQKVFFAPVQGDGCLSGSKKTIFKSRYGMSFFGFLFLGGLGTCPQNLMSTRGVEP